MALTVTATVGDADANSYVTVAEADTYFEAHPEYQTWDKIYTSDKGRWLILATSAIDMEPINGDKNTTTLTSGVPDQALRFPRGVEGDYIPIAVKLACYEQAIHLSKTGTSSSRTELQNQGVIEVQSGDGWRERYKETVSSNTELCSKARTLLLGAGLIKVAGGWA
jgi:hypothetical protein